MKQHHAAIWTYVLLLLLATAACAVPGIGPAAPAATPTPLGDTLSFLIPVYKVDLSPGDSVPGTRLQYIGREGDTYQVLIDGLPATKRIGDSFIWNGVLAPGVYANYNLRLTATVFGALPVAGPVELLILNPEPVETPLTEQALNAQPYFGNILVNYQVPPGRLIPGTSLTYVGLSAQGEGQQASQLAELAGLTGYPYLALGDSLVWTGRLRDNVHVRNSLRVISMNEEGLRLAGTAELWLITE